MNQYTFTAFSDWIDTPTGSDAFAYSSDNYHEMLGLYDQIAFEVYAEQGAGANPSLQVALLHSGDGRTWREKSAVSEVPTYVLSPSTPELNVRVGFDDGTVPTLRFVRLRLKIAAASQARARVRIRATLNDVREHAFARRMRHVMKELEESNPCVRRIQGGHWIDSPINTDFRQETDVGLHGDAAHALEGKGLERVTARELRRRGTAHGYPELWKDWVDNVWKVSDDASICVGADRSATVERRGRKKIIVPHGAGGGVSC
jgi:hypothetical protein